ncbi:hypothetical protein Tco_0066541 [Tanacetum coccineum]
MGGMCLHLCCWHCAYCLRKTAAESLLRQRMQMDSGDGKCVGFGMDVGAAGRKAARSGDCSGVAAKRKEEKG